MSRGLKLFIGASWIGFIIFVLVFVLPLKQRADMEAEEQKNARILQNFHECLTSEHYPTGIYYSDKTIVENCQAFYCPNFSPYIGGAQSDLDKRCLGIQ